jgi:hypothetical protein
MMSTRFYSWDNEKIYAVKKKGCGVSCAERYTPKPVTKAVSILTGRDTDFRKWSVEWPTNV